MFRYLLVVLTAVLFPVSASAQAAGACDLTQDHAVNFADITLAVNMALGLAPCAGNIQGTGSCNVVAVQRVINAALGGSCVTGVNGGSHTVLLSWTASVSQGVSGYYIYRATSLNGPYTKLSASLLTDTSYVDNTVQAGQTYYYVATAVDSSGVESEYSDPPVQAIVPSS
jgi:hypothetical protein